MIKDLYKQEELFKVFSDNLLNITKQGYPRPNEKIKIDKEVKQLFTSLECETPYDGANLLTSFTTWAVLYYGKNGHLFTATLMESVFRQSNTKENVESEDEEKDNIIKFPT